MRKLLLLIVLLIALPLAIQARAKVQGYAQQGGVVIVTAGTSSTTRSIRTFPLCTVTVFVTGTSTLATLFSDNSSTPRANPFTAASDASYFFYVNDGRYDITFSGTGISVPFTLTDILVADSVSSTSIQSLNGLTATAQLFATGTSGSDFNISSVSNTHTFNFPTASGSNRGLLSSANWSTFNGKQNALVNSAGLAAALSDETGTGLSVFNNAPTFIAPVLGAATGTSLRVSATANPLIVSPTLQTYSAYSGANESGPGLFINRTVAAEASDNEHGVIDATQFGRANRAYAAFDSQPVFTGSSSYDHVSNFQARAVMSSSGVLDKWYGFFSFPVTTTGTINKMYSFYAGAGSAVPLSIINRYAFVSESNAGNIGFGTIAPTLPVTLGEPEAVIGTGARMGIFSSLNTYAVIRDTTLNIEASIGTDGTGSFIGSQSNHPLTFVTNATTKATLTLGGQFVLGLGAAATSASMELQSTTGAFIPNKLTTAQRDALTAVAGMVIFNTTTNKHQGYNGTTWNDFY